MELGFEGLQFGIELFTLEDADTVFLFVPMFGQLESSGEARDVEGGLESGEEVVGEISADGDLRIDRYGNLFAGDDDESAVHDPGIEGIEEEVVGNGGNKTTNDDEGDSPCRGLRVFGAEQVAGNDPVVQCINEEDLSGKIK